MTLKGVINYKVVNIVENVEMTGQKKDRSGMGLLWIVHLVCCGLLLVIVLGGISIGAVTSYLLESLVPAGIVVVVIVIGWTAYHLWGRYRFNQNLRSEK